MRTLSHEVYSDGIVYQRCGTSLKKAMNKVIFDKLYVEDGEITGHSLTQTAKAVVGAESKARTYYRRSAVPELAHEALEAANRMLAEEIRQDDGGLTEALAKAGHDTSLFPKEEAGMGWSDDADLLAAAAFGQGFE